MKIKTSVLCLPVIDLQKALLFYKGVFGFRDAKIEEGILSLEFPNLSLFIMERGGYESYTAKVNRKALFPGDAAPAIISCAVESKHDVDRALERAREYGGEAGVEPTIDPTFGGYIGYLSDPDGHLWEIVFPNQ